MRPRCPGRSRMRFRPTVLRSSSRRSGWKRSSPSKSSAVTLTPSCSPSGPGSSRGVWSCERSADRTRSRSGCGRSGMREVLPRAASPYAARVHRALEAGLVAAAVSGAPSTLVTLARGDDVLAGARAAGTLLLPGERRVLPLLAAAVPVHLALSLGWAVALERALPRGRERLTGVLGGLAIAALDLGVIGRRLPAIR